MKENEANRLKLEADTEKFLCNGGCVQECDASHNKGNVQLRMNKKDGRLMYEKGSNTESPFTLSKKE